MKAPSPRLPVLLLLLSPVAAWALRSIARDSGAAQDSLSPVLRAVSLLEDIKAELEKEAGADKDTWDTQSCWCNSTGKERIAAIASAEANISLLSAKKTAGDEESARLTVRIDSVTKQIDEDEAALTKATTMREEQAEEFKENELQMVQDISALKNAMEVLSKLHQPDAASFLQDGSPAATSLRVVLQDLSSRFELMEASRDAYPVRASAAAGHAALIDVKTQNSSLGASLLSFLGRSSNVLPVNLAAKKLKGLAQEASKSTSKAFLQSAEDPPPPYESAEHLGHYSTQSTEVWGILTQMLETFQEDLSTLQEEELKRRQAYEGIAKAKTTQIELGKEQLANLQEQEADNNMMLLQVTKRKEATEAQRSADVQYVSELRATCQTLTLDWEERTSTRADEIKAVTEALAILREDDNREQLAKSISFMQLHSNRTSGSARSTSAAAEEVTRSQAAEVLRRAVRRWDARTGDAEATPGSHRDALSALATSAELDDFTEAKHAIDRMLKSLELEHQKEVDFKHSCETSLREYETEMYSVEEQKNDSAATIESLQAGIETLQDKIDAALAVIATADKEIKVASAEREKGNSVFQETVSDQRKVQHILAEALSRLESFYKTKSESSLAQTVDSQPAAPVHFNEYKKNAGSPAVMSLIEQIIEDSKKLESESIATEALEQSGYESFVTECRTTITAKNEEVLDDRKKQAGLEVDKEQATIEHTEHASELEDLGKAIADQRDECDWLLKHFDTRQRARTEEMEALRSAKAILSGAEG